MFKLFENIVEAFYWLLIFLSPMLIAGLIAALVYFKMQERVTVPLIILGIGLICGVILAERIRRKYGCAEFYARLKRTGGDDKKQSDSDK